MNSGLEYTEASDRIIAENRIRAVMRYLRLIYRHRSMVLGILAAAVFIGVVQFKRTPSRYEASASMMIRHLSASADLERELAIHGLLASYKQLLLSDVVLNGAIQSLEKKPPELAQMNPTLWPDTLRSMLEVSFDPDENIVEVSCRSKDAESTVSVIRAVSAASAKFIEEDQHSLTHDLVQRLDGERKELETRLENRRMELLQARKACGDISALDGADDTHPIVKRVSDLSSQLTDVRSRRIEILSMLETVHSLASAKADLSQVLPMMEKLVGRETILQIPGAAGMGPQQMTEIESKLHDMEFELASRRRHFGAQHPDIVRRTTEIEMQRSRLEGARLAARNRITSGIRDPQAARWFLDTIASELNHIVQYENLLQTEYEAAERDALALNDKLADVRMTEREVESLQQLHTALLNRLSSIDIGQGTGTFRVAALNEPLVPTDPISPVLTQILAVYVVLALALSFGITYVIDLLDDRLTSPEEVQNQLGLPILGVVRPIPKYDTQEFKIHVHGRPRSMETECIRTIRTSIILSNADTRCLAVTSSEQGEGKTTLTVNLAATFAQAGSRTLLIDADMRRPGLSNLLDIRGNGGLSEVLRAMEDVAERCRERIVATEVPDLDVLPCGPRIMNAGVLLSTPSLSAVLDWAMSEYDQVLIDCPPTLPVSDAAIVGNYVDGMVFLLNPDVTRRRSALRAVERLRSFGIVLVGAVTNTAMHDHAGSYSYGYGYGYGQDYSYGHDEEPDAHIDSSEDIDSTGEHHPYRLLPKSVSNGESTGSERRAA